MRAQFVITLACGLLSGCVQGHCQTLGKLLGCDCVVRQERMAVQDMSLVLPAFNASEPDKVVSDGVVFRAIRVAADDFLGLDKAGEPCWDTQAAHVYQTIQRGDVVFVRIDYKPENCGERFHPLDSGATYAVSTEGRLLRRMLDGEPPSGGVPQR